MASDWLVKVDTIFDLTWITRHDYNHFTVWRNLTEQILTEKEMVMREANAELATAASEEIVYKIDIPANRCVKWEIKLFILDMICCA